MKFGYVDDPGQVNHALPETHHLTHTVLKAQQHQKSLPNIYVGCPSWAEKSFVGKVYPSNTKPNKYLEEYAKQFNAIELNATRYGTPKNSTVASWKRAVNADFRFCPKFPQHVSHRRNLATDEVAEDAVEFLETMSLLGENLGTTFMQLPPYFGPGRLRELGFLLDHLPTEYPLAVEVRQKAFFTEDAIEQMHRLLSERNISWILTDVSGRRDVLHMSLSNKTVFFRMTGNKLHETDYERIDQWVERFAEWSALDINEIYVFIHQPAPYKHYVVDLVNYFIDKMLEKHPYSLKYITKPAPPNELLV